MKQATMEDMHLEFAQTIDIKAAPGAVFEGMITRMCDLEGEEGKPRVRLTMERWPGGRWFRDLDGGTGHLWAFVQSIKPPTLLELFGPMFMSHPVAGHIIIRFSPIPEGTRVVFKHQFFGVIPAEVREHVGEGWGAMLKQLKKDAEA